MTPRSPLSRATLAALGLAASCSVPMRRPPAENDYDIGGQNGADEAAGGGGRDTGDGSGGATAPAIKDAGAVDRATTMSPTDATAAADARKVDAHYEPAPVKGYVEMPLFPPGTIKAPAGAQPEQVDGNGLISHVSIPTLRRYPVDARALTGVALIVFPGGGYVVLDMETHAAALAAKLGPMGIAVFGLKYRVGDGTDATPADALADARRAVRLVRSQAAAWGLRDNAIGVASYSAGSNLALALAGAFDAGKPAATDPVERESSRPDFLATMCAWNFGRPESSFSFKSTSPATFLAHAQDDGAAPIAMAQAVERQLKALAVPVHLETYPNGGHDAFNVGSGTVRDWPEKKFIPWLKANKLWPLAQ